jgi:pyruvate formate lyase activating enzyme
MGLGVAVHTNGTQPGIVKELIDKEFVNYFAMDIKAPLNDYKKVVDVEVSQEVIEESIDLIRKSGVDYEFRITVVPRLINEEDIKKIGKTLKGSRAFYIQQFRAGNTLDSEYANEKSYLIPELEKLKKAAEPYFDKVEIRGA